MNFGTYFTVVFILVAVYVIFGNYLYLRRIIPALNKSPGFLPSTQIKDMEAYLKLLLEKGERPWFLFYLKNIKAITLVLVILMFPGFLHILGLV
jgi:hypothetical protein